MMAKPIDGGVLRFSPGVDGGIGGRGRRRRRDVLVVQNGNADQPLAGGRRRHVGRHVGRLEFGRQLPFPLVPPVLEPNFHLTADKSTTCSVISSTRTAVNKMKNR